MEKLFVLVLWLKPGTPVVDLEHFFRESIKGTVKIAWLVTEDEMHIYCIEMPSLQTGRLISALDGSGLFEKMELFEYREWYA